MVMSIRGACASTIDVEYVATERFQHDTLNKLKCLGIDVMYTDHPMFHVAIIENVVHRLAVALGRDAYYHGDEAMRQQCEASLSELERIIKDVRDGLEERKKDHEEWEADGRPARSRPPIPDVPPAPAPRCKAYLAGKDRIEALKEVGSA